jgi:ankyrin repeat protein
MACALIASRGKTGASCLLIRFGRRWDVSIDYRLYLYDLNDAMAAAVPFHASDDMEALELGALLLRASCDVFSRHEVWSGSRHLTGQTVVLPRESVRQMSEARQARAADAEYRLAESFACIRRSQKLLKTLDDMHPSPLIECIRQLSKNIRCSDHDRSPTVLA